MLMRWMWPHTAAASSFDLIRPGRSPNPMGYCGRRSKMVYMREVRRSPARGPSRYGLLDDRWFLQICSGLEARRLLGRDGALVSHPDRAVALYLAVRPARPEA